MDLNLIRQLVVPNNTKILLAVVDGLGGLPHPETGRSELEATATPHLDRLAADSAEESDVALVGCLIRLADRPTSCKQRQIPAR